MRIARIRTPARPAGYGGVAKTLHWLTAFLILTAIPLGLIANGWPYDSAAALQTKYALFSLHKTVGVSVFFVALARIAWALTHPRPPLLHPDRRLEAWAAETVHWLLYGSLVLVPLSGWLHHAATTGFAPVLWPFGQSLPFVPVSEPVAQFFSAWHQVFTKLLIGAVLLHIAGALKHHLIDRDDTLRRMLPGRTSAMVPDATESRVPLWSALAIWAAAIGVGTALGLAHAPSGQTESPIAEPAAPPSQWVVQDGTIAIEISQDNSLTRGSFEDWTATIAFDPDVAGEVKGDVVVEIAIPSLTLGAVTSQAMDPEYFHADAHPTARFAAQILETPDAATGYGAFGTLTLKGGEIPVSLLFDLTLDSESATMTGRTELDRRDYGIGMTTHKDGTTLGFGVNVIIDLTATRAD